MLLYIQIMTERNWFCTLSPCNLVSAFSILAVLYGLLSFNSSGGRSMLIVYFSVPLFLVCLLTDIVAKALIKKILLLWLAKLVVIVLAVFACKAYVFW